MLSKVISLCATSIVLWCVVFWTRERVFKVVIVISVGIHALLLIPFGGLVVTGTATSTGPRLIRYTFIQGVPENKKNLHNNENAIDTREELSTPVAKKSADLSNKNISKPPVAKETGKTDEHIEPGLPRIENVKWFSFDEHPAGESYRKEIKRLIKTNLEIPEQILRNGYEGKQVVHFRLSRSGKLEAVFIESRYESLNPLVNTTSIENIRRISEKFPPLPENVKKDEVWFYVEINYSK